VATALASVGDPNGAVAAFDAAMPLLETETERLSTRYSRAHSLLAAGRLAEGWADHEVRLDQRFARATLFDFPMPRWNGEAFDGMRLLLCGEQGLGDEILFLSAAPDLIDAIGGGKLTIAVEPRLVPLIARSFPQADVFPHKTIAINGRTLRGAPAIGDYAAFDFYAPMASVLSVLRPDIQSFGHQQSPFLTPDPKRVADFKARLDAAGPGPKVGFLWRSVLMTAKRKRFYAPLESWRPALEACKGHLIPMQYGDATDEIAQMRAWGLPVLTFDDLDMKDDLDGVAALSAAIDLIVGPPNASTNIAAAAGAPAWLLGEVSTWTCLGTDHLPWYPKSKFFAADPREGWDPTLAQLAENLAAFR
jgi:hypothetical protein